MPRGKKVLAEQLIPKLREVDVEAGRGKAVLESVKKIGATEQTYCGVLGRDRLSERRARFVLAQYRNMQRRKQHVPDDEPRLATRIVWLACEYGRCGYRRMTTLLHWNGWAVSHTRVERIWRDEGLVVHTKQPKRRLVGPGAFAPRPLTEPDLSVTHPALWVSISPFEQRRLTRGQFWARVELLPRGSQ